MSPISLDLGALVGNVILETTAFDRAYARVVRKFSMLGAEAERAGAGTAKFDESLVTTSRAADKTSTSLSRTTATTRTAATADKRAAVAAKAHADAVARVTAVTNGSAAAGQRVVQSQLRLTASQERYDTVMASGAASTRQLAGAQATLIGSERSLAAASLAADRSVIASSKAAAAARRAYADSMVATGKKMSHAFTLPVAALAGVSVDMAAKFQQSTNVLVTAAGESVKNLRLVRKGILDIATSTGTSWHQVVDGMYQLEKAGYRGAAALHIERAAAQGAREEGAKLSTVTAAMTSIMASYHIPASGAVRVMNMLKTAAGEAKTTLELFSGSLSTVLPVASALKISVADITGALAQMTQHGTSADQAAQELAFAMRNLAAPNAVAVKEMSRLGISSIDVAKRLGDGPGGRGLAGTMNYLSTVAMQHMGKSGLILLNTFNQTKTGVAALKTMYDSMDPAMKRYVHGIESGTKVTKSNVTGGKGFSLAQEAQIKQWTTLYKKVNGYQDVLKQGLPRNQTYTDAIKKMAGGMNGLNAILQTTGLSMDGTTGRITRISDAAKGAGKDVSGWASTQKLFAVQMDVFKQKLARAGIELGTVLIPALSTVVGWVSKLFGWIDHLGSGWKKAIGIAVLFAAALGPIMWIGGKLLTVFGLLSRGATLLATPFTRLATTISETGATMGGLAARATESEAVMTRAVVTGSAEQQAALERLMVTRRAMAVNAAETSALVARSGAVMGAPIVAGGAGAARGGFMGRMRGGGGMGTMMLGMGALAGGQALGHKVGGTAGAGISDAGAGAAVGSMFGPGGLVLGALAGGAFGSLKSWAMSFVKPLSAGFKDFIAIDKHAAESVHSFQAAVLQGGSALKANETAAARAALAHTGLANRAAKAGLTEKDLTNAITGNNAAFDKVVAAWRASGAPSNATIAALSRMHDQYLAGVSAAQKFADVHGTVIASEVRTGTQAAVLSGKLGNLNRMHLTGSAVAAIYNRNVRAVTASVAANGRTLDANTSFGQHNIAAIRRAAVTALEHAQAVYQQTGSLAKADRALQSDRAELYKTATRAGLTKGEVKKLADAIYGVPANRRSKITVDTAGAMRDLSSFGAYYDNYIAGISSRHVPGPVIGAATGPGMRAGIGGLVGGGRPAAAGTQAAFGQATIPPNTRFTVGEGASHTWEAGVTDSQGRASIFSNAQSKAMGIKAPTAYASGTVFHDLGTMLPRGLANGIHEKLPEVRRAAGHMADATNPGIGGGFGGGGFAVQHQTVINPAPGMSEREIGRAAARDAVWQLQMIGGLPT